MGDGIWTRLRFRVSFILGVALIIAVLELLHARTWSYLASGLAYGIGCAAWYLLLHDFLEEGQSSLFAAVVVASILASLFSLLSVAWMISEGLSLRQVLRLGERPPTVPPVAVLAVMFTCFALYLGAIWAKRR